MPSLVLTKEVKQKIRGNENCEIVNSNFKSCFVQFVLPWNRCHRQNQYIPFKESFNSIPQLCDTLMNEVNLIFLDTFILGNRDLSKLVIGKLFFNLWLWRSNSRIEIDSIYFQKVPQLDNFDYWNFNWRIRLQGWEETWDWLCRTIKLNWVCGTFWFSRLQRKKFMTLLAR